MGYEKNLANESDMYSTGYPCTLKLPATVSHLEVMPSGGDFDCELRPAKHSNTNNSPDPSFPVQRRFSSDFSTPPSIYVPNSQQKLQYQQLENNYFASFFKVKGDETDENVTPRARREEIVGSGGNHGLDMRISRVCAENSHSCILPNISSVHKKNHNMVERRRREKLSQRFIALSAIIPNLKKMDKATVLGDAIKYVKQLEDRIKALEEQAPQKAAQPVVYVKKTKLCTDDQKDSSSSKDVTEVSPASINSSSDKDVTETVLTAEIETRVIDRNVLIRIHCEKRKHLMLNFLAELEKLQLTVVNANLISSSETTFDLIFNALMEEGCDLTVKDIVKTVQALLQKMT